MSVLIVGLHVGLKLKMNRFSLVWKRVQIPNRNIIYLACALVLTIFQLSKDVMPAMYRLVDNVHHSIGGNVWQ